MLSKQRRLLPALAIAAVLMFSLPPVANADGVDVSPEVAALATPAEEPAAQEVLEAEPAEPAAVVVTPVVQEEQVDMPAAVEDQAAPAADGEPAEAPAAAQDQAAPRAAAAAPAAAAAAADCPPSDRSDAITGITVNPTVVEVNDIVNVNFSAVLTDGGCEGDFINIPLPPQLAGLTGTFPITAPDGSVIAQMVVTAGMITITFNDYLESHENVRFNGFLKAKVTNEVSPGEDYDLEWNVGDEVFITPITTEPCDDCNAEDKAATKFAIYQAGPPPYVEFGITTAQTRTATEQITITDLLGPGQELDCTRVRMLVGDSVDVWGNIEWDGQWTAFTVDSCDTQSVTVSLTATRVGQFFKLDGRTYPTEVRESYTDSAEVTQAGQTTGVRATARITDGGGDVDGDGRIPKVDIEKWSTNEDITSGDHDTDPKTLDPQHAEKLTFTITNTGTEVLKDIVVSDATTAGTGTVENLVCTFPEGAAAGTTWVGPFAIGASFTCTGTLTALGADGKHTDNATVTGVGRKSNISVTDKDPWMAVTPPKPTEPKVDIEKWSTVDGPIAGDFDDDPKTIDVGEGQNLTFTVTNSGNEDLVNVRVSDELISGNGKIKGLTCDFSALGGPASGTEWNGPFKVGDSFDCEGTLTGLKAGQKHRDRATVTATGVDSGTSVTDKDDWNAATQPGLPNTGTPNSDTPTPALPATGSRAELLPLGLMGVLMIAIGLNLTRRRASMR